MEQKLKVVEQVIFEKDLLSIEKSLQIIEKDIIIKELERKLELVE